MRAVCREAAGICDILAVKQMNYYEELGLSRNASAEEIRQAYKSVARLLHPDRQSDEDLRKMAALQMTRLNEILATLGDPGLRARYDATLRARPAGPAHGVENSPPPRAYVKRHPLRTGRVRPSAGAIVGSIILMAAASVFAFVFLYFEHDSGLAVYRGTEETGRPAPPEKDPVQTAAPRPTRTASAVRVDRPSRRDELNRPVRRSEKPELAVPARASTLPVRDPTEPSGIVASQGVEVKQPAVPSAPSSVVAVTKPVPTPRDPFIGTWLYVKPRTEEAGSKTFAYRPEYIEMIIKAGQEGKVLGRYKGRFLVSDRPLSSEVDFRFEGTTGEGTNVFAWRGDDGASGQIRMKVVSEGVMEVNWYTTRFGSAQKLASGTAVLHRD